MKRTILVPILMTFAFSMTAGCGAGGSAKTGESTMAEGGKSGKSAGEGKSNSEKSNSEKSNKDGHDGDMKAMCPMDVAGTQVATEDIDGGIAIVFTTTGDVADLRARVSHLAEMHKEHAQDGEHEHEGHEMPAAGAVESDVEGGARLELKAADAATVDALRAHVKEHVAKMQSSGTCPHMGHDDDDKPQG